MKHLGAPPACLCCAAPRITFAWDLGVGADREAVLRISRIRCTACGKVYQVLGDEGDLQECVTLDVYVSDYRPAAPPDTGGLVKKGI